jgi:hypothetical protein
MTRRERLERKLEKRRQWADGRRADAAARFDAADAATAGIPFGQPILVGHHSEKRHRAALDRSDRNMAAGCESLQMAEHHESKAAGLESQLERSIFSDDRGAIEALTEKVRQLEEERDTAKRLNSYWRKHGTMKGCAGITDETAARLDADIPTRYSWERQPVPAYRLQNLGAEIRRAKQRIEEIRKRNARAEQAEQAGGSLVTIRGQWAVVTFAEKPAREILDALKAAGFRWGAGSWGGYADKLPAAVRELASLADPAAENSATQPLAIDD